MPQAKLMFVCRTIVFLPELRQGLPGTAYGLAVAGRLGEQRQFYRQKWRRTFLLLA
jgi:hypothetical protein